MTNRDPFALRVPDAAPEAAASAVAALMRVALACDEAGRLLERSIGLTAAWTGEASLAFQEQRNAVTARCAGLAEASGAAAGVVQRWWSPASADKAAMARAAERADLARRGQEAALAGGQPYRADLAAEVDAATGEWTRAHASWTSGAHALRHGLHGVRVQVRDRPRSFGDHAEDFATTLWDRAVAGPAVGAWALTGQAFVDRDAWWDDVTAVPGTTADAVERLVTDPLGVLGDAVDAQAWREGHVGEALGAAAALAVPGPKGLQGLDDLFRGVDLARHEGVDLGHTLARHVHVDDAYLVDRLAHGTLLDDGTRGFVPSAASRFFDRATAEAAITRTLATHADAVREFAAGSDGQLTLRTTVAEPVGVAMRVHEGDYVQNPANGVVVVLRRHEKGIFVFTAYAEVPK